MKLVCRPALRMFHPAQRQDKYKKFLEHKSLSGLYKPFLCQGKMHGLDGLGIGDKTILFLQLQGQDILHFANALQCLLHRFYHRVVRQPRCQGIDRLHGMSLFFIFCSRIIDLRMLHHKSFPFPHNPAPQRKRSALAQRGAKKRHAEPDNLQCTCKVF